MWTTCGRRPRSLRRQADRAGDAGAAEAAVAVRVLREVLLVVRLGVVERPRRRELGRDLAVAGAAQLGLIGGARALHLGALLLARPVDRRAVLRADVVALAEALRRVVSLPEAAQDLAQAHLRRVEDDEDGLRVVRPAGADLLVGRIRRLAARVADRRGVDAGRLPEDPLRAPEAAEPELDLLEAVGERRVERRAEDVVGEAGDDRLLAAAQRRVGGQELGGLADEEAHTSRVAAPGCAARVRR